MPPPKFSALFHGETREQRAAKTGYLEAAEIPSRGEGNESRVG